MLLLETFALLKCCSLLLDPDCVFPELKLTKSVILNALVGDFKLLMKNMMSQISKVLKEKS